MTTKQKKKKTREDMYLPIVDDYVHMHPIGGRFSGENIQHEFHYMLMNSHEPYALYDGNGKTAVVLFGPTADDEKVKEMIDSLHGEFFIPNMKLPIINE